MSKIRNSIYGLALGDAIAYRTEFLRFDDAIKQYGTEHLSSLQNKLVVSDDTQMSLYLLEGFKKSYKPNKPFVSQHVKITESIARSFIDWLNDPQNIRAPGNACISSLQYLEQNLPPQDKIRNLLTRNKTIEDFLIGGIRNRNSKGSGTVMRSPWIGLLHGIGKIPDESFEEFCNIQSSITHQHPTALNASYLTALLTSKLYKEELKPGELREFASFFCMSQKQSTGWYDLSDALDRIKNLPSDYANSTFDSYDPSYFIGFWGTAENVLITAIALIDNFGYDPVEVLRRCMFSSGDSDTIGAVAGGILGAYYENNIWESILHLTETRYIPWLNEITKYIENIQSL